MEKIVIPILWMGNSSIVVASFVNTCLIKNHSYIIFLHFIPEDWKMDGHSLKLFLHFIPEDYDNFEMYQLEEIYE
jgi:hypothetical protein